MEYFNQFYQNPVMSTHSISMYADILGHEGTAPDEDYVDLVFDVIRDMHSLEQDRLVEIFKYLLEADAYLLDVIIMCWCVPTSGFGRRQRMRLQKVLIEEQLPKLLAIKDIEPIKQFCIEISTRTCQVPVHCFDLIWPYVTLQTYEMAWRPQDMGSMIKLDAVDDVIKICVDAHAIIALGLGNVPNEQGLTFKQLIQSIAANEQVLALLHATPTGHHLVKQIEALRLDLMIL